MAHPVRYHVVHETLYDYEHPVSVSQQQLHLAPRILDNQRIEAQEIIIDPDQCPNTAREFTTYELEKDQHGNFKSQYPDKDNHTIDATRYALKNDMRTGKKSIGRSVFGL